MAEDRDIIFYDFRKGLHSPAQSIIQGNSCAPEFETMLNCFPLRDGSLTRRPGFTYLANFKYDASGNYFLCNRNMYYSSAFDCWVCAGNDGAIYKVKETAIGVKGATRELYQIASDRMTNCYLSTYDLLFAGQEYKGQIDSGGLFSRGNNTNRTRFYVERNTSVVGAGNRVTSLNKISLTGVGDLSLGDASVYIDGIIVHTANDNIFVIKRDGKVYRYAGYSLADAQVEMLADTIGEYLPYTLVSSPHGVICSTRSDIYVWYGNEYILNQLLLKSPTKEKFSDSLPLIQYAPTIDATNETLTALGTNLTTGLAPTVTSFRPGYPGTNANDGNVATAWYSDYTNACTGGTATASNTGAGSDPANLIDNNEATSWVSPTVANTTNEWVNVQFTAGKVIKGIVISTPYMPNNIIFEGQTGGVYSAMTVVNTYTSGVYHGYSFTNTNILTDVRISFATTVADVSPNFRGYLSELFMYENDPEVAESIIFDFSSNKSLAVIETYENVDRTAELFTSTNGTTYTVVVPEVSIYESDTGYYRYALPITTARYMKWEKKPVFYGKNWFIYIKEIKCYELGTSASYVCNRMSTAIYIPKYDQYWMSYRRTDSGVWKTYIYDFKYECFWEFQATTFDQGSYGIKGNDLHLALNNYTVSAVVYPAGIWRYGDADTADPDGDMTVQFKTGKTRFISGEDYEFHIDGINITGKGWTTLNFYYEIDGTSYTYTKDISGLGTNPDVNFDTRIRCKTFQIELIGTVGRTEGTKEVYIKSMRVIQKLYRGK